MRDLQATMLGAVLGGEGLEGVAELAAMETGGPVAIVLPARGLSAASAGAGPAELARHAPQRLEGGESEWAGALAEPIGERLFAILPAPGGDDAAEKAGAKARGLVHRLRSHGPAAVSSFYADPGDLHQALREAELVLEVVRRDGRLA